MDEVVVGRGEIYGVVEGVRVYAIEEVEATLLDVGEPNPIEPVGPKLKHWDSIGAVISCRRVSVSL